MRRSELRRRTASARFVACLGLSPGLTSRTRLITPAGVRPSRPRSKRTVTSVTNTSSSPCRSDGRPCAFPRVLEPFRYLPRVSFGTFLLLAYPAIERLGLAFLAASQPSTAASILLRFSGNDQLTRVSFPLDNLAIVFAAPATAATSAAPSASPVEALLAADAKLAAGDWALAAAALTAAVGGCSPTAAGSGAATWRPALEGSFGGLPAFLGGGKGLKYADMFPSPAAAADSGVLWSGLFVQPAGGMMCCAAWGVNLVLHPIKGKQGGEGDRSGGVMSTKRGIRESERGMRVPEQRVQTLCDPIP